MDIFWIRVVSQAGVYATFALYLAWSLRRGAREWIPLAGTVVYAVVFEHFNMLRYAHVRGGYSYHPASWLFVWNDVPLYIPLAWAFIVATSRALTDELRLAEWAKPFSDALLALLIDLSLDVIAIRLHFWTWRGVAWNDAFFGVPADNFLGWLLVTFTFSLLTRALWQRPQPGRPQADMPPAYSVGSGSQGARALPQLFLIQKLFLMQILLVPPLAYLLYLGIEAVVHGVYIVFHATTLRQFGVLGGVLTLFVLVVAWGGRPAAASAPDESSPSMAAVPRWQRAASLHGPRHIFHIFAVIGFCCLPLSARSAPLLAITFLAWLLELLLLWRASRYARKA